jgi:hypothetical protein
MATTCTIILATMRTIAWAAIWCTTCPCTEATICSTSRPGRRPLALARMRIVGIAQSMLWLASWRCSAGGGGGVARFRGPESRPPRAVLNLSHKDSTLQPGALAPPVPYPRNSPHSAPKFASRGRTRLQSHPGGCSWLDGATPSVKRAVPWQGSACIGSRYARRVSRMPQGASRSSYGPTRGKPNIRVTGGNKA